MISGINHVTFSVSQLERSFEFYREVLGFRAIARWRRGAYFLAGDAWIALIVDGEARPGPLPEYSHVAFTVASEEFAAMSARIHAVGAEIFQPNTSEGDSLYFLDPDGHKLEIHVTDLVARIAAARAAPRDDFEILDEP